MCAIRDPVHHPGLPVVSLSLSTTLAPIAEPIRTFYNGIADEAHQYIADVQHRTYLSPTILGICQQQQIVASSRPFSSGTMSEDQLDT